MTTNPQSTSLFTIINGQRVPISGYPSQTTLLDFLRDQGLTGAKEGCAEGECGACTVALVTPRGAGSAYTAINSCLMFLPMAAGREIYTVEGLEQAGELQPAQAAIAAGGGSQCGYCTPGFVMSLFAEHYRPDRVGPCDPHALSGNLCRCTGYRPIRDAALSLGPAPEGPFKERLKSPASQLSSAQAEGFSRPASLEECFALAAAHPDVKWVSGATDLGVESNLRDRQWPHLASLEAVGELREFGVTDGKIRIGAGLTLSEIETRWKDAPEAVRQWFALFASLPIRNRATLGGNLATASPIGDSAPLLLALGASVEIASPQGRRLVPLSGFFQGYRKTALEAGEILSAVEVPLPPPAYLRFYKVSKRRMDDISTVAAGFSMSCDAARNVQSAVFALGGVAAVPLRVFAAEEAVLGQRWDLAAVRRVQAAFERTLQPMSDHRGSAEYRRAVAKSLVEKFWWESRKQEGDAAA